MKIGKSRHEVVRELRDRAQRARDGIKGDQVHSETAALQARAQALDEAARLVDDELAEAPEPFGLDTFTIGRCHKGNKADDGAWAAARWLGNVGYLVIEKNTGYGNSALDPVRIFSRASPDEQLLVRIDDKLSRIARGAGLLATDEDVLRDLAGYFALLAVRIESTKKAAKPTADPIKAGDVVGQIGPNSVIAVPSPTK